MDKPAPVSTTETSDPALAGPFDRILVPLPMAKSQSGVLLPATVLSAWLDAPVQLVCDRDQDLEQTQVLAAGLGVPIEPVVQLEDLHAAEGLDAMNALGNSHSPVLVIVDSSPEARALAAASSQPVLITADGLGHRMPLGPLVCEITENPADLDALALGAVIGRTLEEPVRLVVGTDTAPPPPDQSLHADAQAADKSAKLVDAEQRVRQMGCEVGVDALRAHGLHPLVLAGRTRQATAMIIPQNRVDEPGLVDKATRHGLNVFVAPTPRSDHGRPAPYEVDLTRTPQPTPAGASLTALDRDECLARLQRHSVARIGYVDAGWPVVLPVNYRLHNGDIFIRTLGGGKLRAAQRHDTVCLEIDGFDERLRTGWSVLAHGALEVITDAETLRLAWINDPQPWVAADDWSWLRMVPFSVSGREVWPHTGDSAGDAP